MRIVLAGCSGMIGGAIESRIRSQGHDITRLTRGGDAGSYWNPQEGQLDRKLLDGADYVICLSGASIGRPWTTRSKRVLRESRIRSASLIAETIAGLASPLPVFLCASAVGIYGDCGDERVTETSSSGSGFLAELCEEWEMATQPARDAGARVVNLRFGVVLDGHEGMLGLLRPLFRAGLGGRLGKGQQYFPWVSLHDAVGIIEHCLFNASVSGPVNVVSPGLVTNANFTRALASALKRPAVFHVPAPILRLALGQMAVELMLAGQRVVPTRLTETGYRFEHEELQSALPSILAVGPPRR